MQLFLSFLFVCVPNRVFHNTNNAICTQGRKTRLPFLMHSFIMCAFWFRHGWLLKSSPLLSAGSIHFREHNGKPTRAAEVRASLPSPPLPPASLTTDLCLPPLPLSLHVSHLLFLSHPQLPASSSSSSPPLSSHTRPPPFSNVIFGKRHSQFGIHRQLTSP